LSGAFGFDGAEAQAFVKPRQVIRMGRPPVRLEILTSISGVDFEGCFERRVEADFGGFAVHLIGLEDLKQNKLASRRLKDKLDLEQLG
jgi:hypothetical protein